MRAAIYLRVSTDDQTTENQERELRAAADRAGHEIVAVYRDDGISGSKGRDRRPGFDDLHKAAARRQFDIVMVWSVDRLSRSLQDLIAFMMELRSLKIGLYLHKQGLDTTTPAGKLMYQVLGSFAEFESEMIQARVKAGMARAKAQGKHVGRPAIKPELAQAIRDALAVPGRPGIRVIAKQFNVSPQTVQTVARA
jgi:DNA invertase Pin-like site-specific DNA recombinase